METASSLMLIKVLGIGLAGVALVWWQFRDLARARQQTAKELAQRADAGASPDADRASGGPSSGS